MTTTADRMLAVMALRKIVNAQTRGTLPTNLRISTTGHQVLVRDPGDEVVAWIKKTWPDGTEKVNRLGSFETKNGRRTGKRADQMEYRAPLRPASNDLKHFPDHPPVVEVWYQVPHTCGSFRGYANESGHVVWRCFYCQKAITKTQARKLGLLPPLPKRTRRKAA